MESLGEYLRRERERCGIALDDIARVTRVRRQYLEAIEQDRHDLLPAPPFVRGFLSAYAKEVGLAAADVLTRYEAAGTAARPSSASSGAAGPDAGRDAPPAAGPLAARPPAARPPAASASAAAGAPAGRSQAGSAQPGEPRPAHQGILVLAGLVAFAALAVVGSILARPATPPARLPERAAVPRAPARPVTLPAVTLPAGIVPAEEAGAGAPAPAAPVAAEAVVDALAGSRTPLPDAPVPAAATDIAAPATGPAPAAAVAPARLSTLAAVATEETWLQVTVDAGPPAESLLHPGQRASWRGSRFDIVVGNAGGVTLELDGVPQPPLGQSGRKVSLTLPRPQSR